MTHIGSAPSTARDISRALTRASRSNFYYAFLFLPRHKREALYAVYAFCRVTDDLVDETAATPSGHGQPAAGTPPPAGIPSPAGTPVERLKTWREELEACFRGEATHPVTQRLAETIRTFRIPHGYFEELLNGVEMDLAKFRYATFAELQQYCYRVAGVVGLMCIEVFGYTNPMTRTYAQHLGTAFQLTNILRDLATDGERGRIYLPQEDLKRFGVTEADLLERRVTPAFLDLMRFEVGRARQFYAAARAALPAEDRRTMLAAEIMRAIYTRILDRIEGMGYDVFSRRIRLSDTHRLWLALHCWARHRLRTA
ncbi:MAG: squalene/phytoene synthase family protein [candidate division NC10 bacterium]|nr:squalene/phytoene synthase family protein [candidate division NC10 bacterium]